MFAVAISVRKRRRLHWFIPFYGVVFQFHSVFGLGQAAAADVNENEEFRTNSFNAVYLCVCVLFALRKLYMCVHVSQEWQNHSHQIKS